MKTIKITYIFSFRILLPLFILLFTINETYAQQTFSAFSATEVRALYNSTLNRFNNEPLYSQHEYANYFKSLFELSDRNINASQQDAISTSPLNKFMSYEVDRQIYEARKLLLHIQQDLDLIDYNTDIDYTANTINIKTYYGAIGNGTTNDHAAFRNALTDIQAAGEPARLFIPAGQYLLNGQWGNGHLYLLNQQDLIIEGEPGTVLILPRKRGFMDIIDSRNIQLRNLTIDFRPTAFSQGKVTSVDYGANTIDITLDSGYEDPTITQYTAVNRFRLWVFNPANGLVKHDDRVDIHINSVSPLGGRVYRFQVAENITSSTVVNNDLCAIIPRNNGPQNPPLQDVNRVSALRSSNSQFITLADMRIYGGQHYFFLPFNKSDGLKFLRSSFERMPGTNRLAANLADGITGHDLARAPYVESCRIASTYDDAIHISSTWSTVLNVNSNEIIVDRTDSAYYPIGEMITIADFNTMSIRDYGVIVNAQNITFSGGQKVLLTLDRSPSGVVAEGNQATGKTADRIFSHAFSGSGLVVRNSFLGLNRANGIRLRSANAIIENNVFGLHAGWTFLKEWPGNHGQPGFFPSHIIIRNNISYNSRHIHSVFMRSDGTTASGVPVRYCIDQNTVIYAESRFLNDYPDFYWNPAGPHTLNYNVLLDVIADNRWGAEIWKSTITNVVTLNKIEVQPKVIIWPNPIVNHIINLDISSGFLNDVNVSLTDIMGRRVFGKTIKNSGLVKIHINNEIKNGVYLLKLTDGKNHVVKYIFLQN